VSVTELLNVAPRLPHPVSRPRAQVDWDHVRLIVGRRLVARYRAALGAGAPRAAGAGSDPAASPAPPPALPPALAPAFEALHPAWTCARVSPDQEAVGAAVVAFADAGAAAGVPAAALLRALDEVACRSATGAEGRPRPRGAKRRAPPSLAATTRRAR
jgi:hypothetical protein